MSPRLLLLAALLLGPVGPGDRDGRHRGTRPKSGGIECAGLEVSLPVTIETVSGAAWPQAEPFEVTSNPFTVTITATDNNGNGVASVTWTADGGSASGTCTGTEPNYTCTVTMAGVGPEIFTFLAIDLCDLENDEAIQLENAV